MNEIAVGDLSSTRQVRILQLLLIVILALFVVVFVISPIIIQMGLVGLISGFAIVLLYQSKPQTAIELYIVALLFFPPFGQGLSFVNRGIRIDQLLCFLLFFSFAASNVAKGVKWLKLDSFLVIFGCYVVWYVVSALKVSEFGLQNLVIFQGNFVRPLIVFVVFRSLSNKLNIKHFMKILFVMGSVDVAIGILQYVDFGPVTAYLDRFYPMIQTVKLGDEFGPGSAAQGFITSVFDGFHLNFSGWLLIFSMFLVGWISYVPDENRLTKWFVLALVLFDAIVGKARTGFFSIVGTLSFYGLFFRKYKLLLLGALLVIAVLYFAPSDRLSNALRFMDDTGQGDVFSNRLSSRLNYLERITSSPIVGTGTNMQEGEEGWYLDEWAGRGIIGLTLLFSINIVIVLRSRKLLSGTSDPHQKAIALATLLMTVGFLLVGVGSSPWGFSRGAEVYWMFVGLTFGLTRERADSNQVVHDQI